MKKTAAPQKVKIRVGLEEMEFTVVPMQQVQKANAAIQNKVQPVLNELKRKRVASEISASRIILNA